MAPRDAKQAPRATDIIMSNESKQMYRSNLMRLQLEELHTGITPSYEKLRKVEQFVENVYSALKKLQPKTIDIASAGRYPGVVLSKPVLTDIPFTPPTAITEVGSWKEKSMVKPLHVIDVSVVIPSSVFGPKDLKSNRYFDRRSVYMAEMFTQLKSSLADLHVTLEELRKPTICVGFPGSQWVIHVTPSVSRDIFPSDKLTPEYKNVNESTDIDPFYNASILEDMYSIEADGLISAVSSKYVNWTRAVQLGKVWLYRRNALVHSTNSVGLSGFDIRVILAHICTAQSLPKQVSGYQLFKLFLTFVSKTNWRTKSVIFGANSNETMPSFFLDHPTYLSPIIASLNGYNLLWRVCIGTIEELAFEAARSLTILDDVAVTDPFELLFCSGSRAHDLELVIKTGGLVGSRLQLLVNKLDIILKTGLGKRLWNGVLSMRADGESVYVSGDIDCTTLTSLVDKGPSADSKEAVAFKKFWASKSELRRFKDGSILECVVWNKSGSSVVTQIVEYLLPLNGVASFTISDAPLAGVVNSVNHVPLWVALESLRSKISSVKTPIRILDLKPVHARFTGTDLSGSGAMQPLDCVLEFESSTAWPVEDKLALWHSKCAFLLAVRDGLLKQYCTVEIAAEDVSESPFIDVKTGDQFAFRIRIFAQNELMEFNRKLLSQNNPPTAGEIKILSNEYFASALRTHVHACTAEFPALAPAIVAAKSWLDNHLLLEPWLHEWVEITMVHVMKSKSGPTNAIGQSAHVAFLEWLFFVAHHQFRKNPIFMVDWQGNDGSSRAVLEANYEDALDARKNCWWMASPIDAHCLFLRRPSEWEADRIQSLAKKALGYASQKHWDLISLGTDNSSVYNLLFTVNDPADACKLLNDQFRKLITFRCSKRHGIVGGVLDKAGFVPKGKHEKKDLHMSIDGIVIPDFASIIEKIQKILDGAEVSSISFR